MSAKIELPPRNIPTPGTFAAQQAIADARLAEYLDKSPNESPVEKSAALTLWGIGHAGDLIKQSRVPTPNAASMIGSWVWLDAAARELPKKVVIPAAWPVTPGVTFAAYHAAFDCHLAAGLRFIRSIHAAGQVARVDSGIGPGDSTYSAATVSPALDPRLAAWMIELCGALATRIVPASACWPHVAHVAQSVAALVGHIEHEHRAWAAGDDAGHRGEDLCDRHRCLLVAMLELGCVNSDARQSADILVVKAFGRDACSNNHKQPLSDLVKNFHMAESKGGPGGGYWLTPRGIKRAESVRTN